MPSIQIEKAALEQRLEQMGDQGGIDGQLYEVLARMQNTAVEIMKISWNSATDAAINRLLVAREKAGTIGSLPSSLLKLGEAGAQAMSVVSLLQGGDGKIAQAAAGVARAAGGVTDGYYGAQRAGIGAEEAYWNQVGMNDGNLQRNSLQNASAAKQKTQQVEDQRHNTISSLLR